MSVLVISSNIGKAKFEVLFKFSKFTNMYMIN